MISVTAKHLHKRFLLCAENRAQMKTHFPDGNDQGEMTKTKIGKENDS